MKLHVDFDHRTCLILIVRPGETDDGSPTRFVAYFEYLHEIFSVNTIDRLV